MFTTTETAVFAADHRSRLVAEAQAHRTARRPRPRTATPSGRRFAGRLVPFTRPALKGAR
jgi:hypothetical protein